MTLKGQYINCLIYFDEENTGTNRQSKWEEFFAHTSGLMNTYDKFLNLVNIELHAANSWNTYWDSNDNEHYTTLMLQEATQENGGTYDSANDWWVWTPKEILGADGKYYWIDTLIFITNQDMWMIGVSPPM
jgi:hypothetical protein